MKIRVDKDNLRIIELSQLESGEVDVTEVNFIFTPEYEDLIKTAVFTLGDKSYKVILQNDKCFVPTEVLVEGNKITIGVYAFKQDSEELILRYSPVPVTAEILKGSYVEEAENTSHPTPTEIEQLLDLINSNSIAIDDLTERVETLEQDKDKCEEDIDSIKEDLIDIKSDIQDLEDDVTSIRSDINNINENIDDIEDDISDINSDISNINTSITNIERVDERQTRRLNAIDNILRQWPKTEYQIGTNINLGKTIEAVVQYEDDKVLYGDTSQETTNGYNLWGGFNDFTKTQGNVTFSTKTNGTITAKGTSNTTAIVSALVSEANSNNLYKTLQAGTYTIKCEQATSNFKIQILNVSNSSLLLELTSSSSSTITLNNETNLFNLLWGVKNIYRI